MSILKRQGLRMVLLLLVLFALGMPVPALGQWLLFYPPRSAEVHSEIDLSFFPPHERKPIEEEFGKMANSWHLGAPLDLWEFKEAFRTREQCENAKLNTLMFLWRTFGEQRLTKELADPASYAARVINGRCVAAIGVDLVIKQERAQWEKWKKSFYQLSQQPKDVERPKRHNGTCFAVSPDGAILTSYHVVTKADSIKIYFVNGRSAPAVVEQAGATTDLALLRIAQPTPAHLSLAPSRSAQVGQSVFTLGFPATSLLGVEPKFSEGSISALSGPGGEASLMQISVPVQPGNSGGPLVNDQGQVIGIITATAAILPFVEATGSLPQNVNWAVKADYARPLFNAPAGGVSQAPTRQEAIEKARRAVCRVEASTK